MIKNYIKIVFILIFLNSICMADQFKYKWSSYTTYFQQNIDERGNNIETGAKYLDGKILFPRVIFSFNNEITEKISDGELGTASTLIGDKRVLGLGGGLCQVSSTLYAAVLYAGLSIFERKPHSKLVSYIPPGLDATVSIDEGIDLKFYNPYTCNLMIKSEVEGNSLKITILGTKPKVREIKVYVAKPIKQEQFLLTTTTRTVFSSGKELFSEIVSRDKYLIPE
ncbi:MAG TPA: VanW family protein [Candidatus Ratteibacteria bacterium]|nr:VanW family protein [Candidatus Ratteibacteria bacterium]